MAQTRVDPSAKREADALLVALAMAERHHQWAMMRTILSFLEQAGARVMYLGPSTYALQINNTNP